MLVRALRVLIDFTGPDHPLLRPPPTSVPEPYFISSKGQQSWLKYNVGVCLSLHPESNSDLHCSLVSSALSPTETFKRILNKKFLQRQRTWLGNQKSVNFVTVTGFKKTDEQWQEFRKVNSFSVSEGCSRSQKDDIF